MPLIPTFPKNNDKDIIAGVYEIKHVSTGKSYIGSTGNLGSRIGTNKSSLRLNKHKNKPLQQAYNNNSDVELKVLKLCESKEEALNEEQKILDKLLPTGNLFNIGKDARASARGLPVSDERRKNLSEKLKNRVHSPETIEKMKKAQAGKVISEETRAKIKAYVNSPEFIAIIKKANTGRKHTEETKEKLRQVNLGRKLSEETRLKMTQNAVTPAKPVIINGVIYPSIKAASRELDLNPGSISSKLSSKKDENFKYF